MVSKRKAGNQSAEEKYYNFCKDRTITLKNKKKNLSFNFRAEKILIKHYGVMNRVKHVAIGYSIIMDIYGIGANLYNISSTKHLFHKQRLQ